MTESSWNETWRYVAGVFVCAVFGYFAFVRGADVPLMSGVNLGFHEVGHFATFWMPHVATAMMGSIAQVLAPLAFAVYFFVWRRDHFAAVFCIAWMATSMQNVSVYIVDAPYELFRSQGATTIGPTSSVTSARWSPRDRSWPRSRAPGSCC